MKGLGCAIVTEEKRHEINRTYYSLGSLPEQRQWVSRHVKSMEPNTTRTDSRKTRTMEYYLPTFSGDVVRVCRQMFLGTVNIAERQVRTALEKITRDGHLEPENRGGRRKMQKQRDEQVRQLVKAHIDRFPRTESHYCRADTTCQYLSSELYLTKMHHMYLDEHSSEDAISFSFYCRVFNRMNLKFTRPKKDLCGICEGFRNGTDEEKATLRQEYERHIKEKVTVRGIKQALKEENNEKRLVASFDLEQVIFLPRSNRCEVFYKRRLSCYNFSVFNIKTKKAHCFLWNESIAARGANEIASNLATYLMEADEEGYEIASLFCDGCTGQNKNSIVCAMLNDVLRKTANLRDITIFYFETNHGQSEGDSVHSVVERTLARAGDIFVPSQLSTLISLACVRLACVRVCTENIFDYKALSQSNGILRVRISEEGTAVRWPDIMQLHISKDTGDIIKFKMSHTDESFQTLSLPQRRCVIARLEKAYSENGHIIATAKYDDLMTLCNGTNPVIRNPEHISFYRNLRH